LVIGGVANLETYYDSIEILDIGKDKKTCSSVPNYPVPISAVTAAYYQDKLTVCGGYTRLDDYIDYCFELNSIDDAWVEIESLDTSKDCIRSSIIEDKWVLSGGDINATIGSFDDKVLIYNGEFSNGPELPAPKGENLVTQKIKITVTRLSLSTNIE